MEDDCREAVSAFIDTAPAIMTADCRRLAGRMSGSYRHSTGCPSPSRCAVWHPRHQPEPAPERYRQKAGAMPIRLLA